MMALQQALSQYVDVRRALGTQLTEPAKTLRQFVAFVACGGPGPTFARRCFDHPPCSGESGHWYLRDEPLGTGSVVLTRPA